MSAPTLAGGLSLFPNTSNTPRPPSRSRGAATPQEGPSPSTETTPPRPGRQVPARRNSSATREGRQRAVSNNPWQHALDARQHQLSAESTAGPSTTADPVIETTTPQPVADVPQRCETAFSEAQTLVRSPSQRSRSSIAKPPLAYVPGESSSSVPPGTAISEPPALRSIFPRYNPQLPLDRQEYYPTQASPTHIPQAAISRPLYSPRSAAANVASPSDSRSPHGGGNAQVLSPALTANSSSRWPGLGHRHPEPAAIPPVSTTEDLRTLWKVTNGWRASSLEARNYCLKLTAAPDAPTYTLSSASNQPFYCLRIDPTSASALVSLSRYDPNKPFKPNTSSAVFASSSAAADPSSSPSLRASSSSSSSRRSEHQLQNVAHNPSTTSSKHQKYWQEVLATTLEPSALSIRRHQPQPQPPPQSPSEAPGENPNDGLVAALWPAAAARLVADRSNDATTVALAQAESARLVWDADTGNHYLVHPALAVPFCVTCERHPAFSRTEYALEHLESPQHLARLTLTQGQQGGWLEVDTNVARQVPDAVYLVDVAVAALLIVAHLDGHINGGGGAGGGFMGGGGVEVFEPPPVVPAAGDGSLFGLGRGSEDGGRGSRLSRASRASRREAKRGKGGTVKKKKRMEQFEIDLESQSSGFAGKMGGGQAGEKDKIPGVAKALIGLLTVTLKCFVWCATLAFRALMAILSGLARCCGAGKL